MPRRGPVGYVDDTEEPLFEVTPSDNVYSYFIFISPTEWKKEGSQMTKDTFMSWILIAMSLFAQSVLIYAVFFDVVVNNIEWQNGIMKVGGGNAGALFSEKPRAEECNDGGSLCFYSNGTYSCAPPSVVLTGRWDELDTNGDGVWARAEAAASRESLRCKYAVDPLEVFDVFQRFLTVREDVIWLHPDVKAGQMIHKPYFTYAVGDIAMCGYRTKDMCPNILGRGFFDAPLTHGTAPRVGTTIESALDYCNGLLRPGGHCELILPSTYATWKIESVGQCMDPSYEKFDYSHPATGVTKSLLEVDYQAREDYERCGTPLFIIYKSIIVGMWLLAMLVEFRQIVIILTWVQRFPSAEEFGPDAVLELPDPAEPGDVKYQIQGITRSHRINVGITQVLRLVMTIVLTWVGVSFLSKQVDYMDLLLDGVALIFILEIASIIYQQALRDDVRDQTESIDPMKVRMYGIDYLNRRPALVDMFCIALVLGCCAGVQYYLQTTIVNPVASALECTCLSTGEQCFEEKRFSKEFWDNYWQHEVPGVFEDLKALGAPAAPPGAGVALAVGAPAVAPHGAVAASAAAEWLDEEPELEDEPELETIAQEPEQKFKALAHALRSSRREVSAGHISAPAAWADSPAPGSPHMSMLKTVHHHRSRLLNHRPIQAGA